MPKSDHIQSLMIALFYMSFSHATTCMNWEQGMLTPKVGLLTLVSPLLQQNHKQTETYRSKV